MKVPWVRHNVRDAGKRDLGKMFGSAFHALGREAKTLGGVDDPKHRRASGARPGQQANPADRKLQPVIMCDRRQTGSGAVSFVALPDSSHSYNEVLASL